MKTCAGVWKIIVTKSWWEKYAYLTNEDGKHAKKLKWRILILNVHRTAWEAIVSNGNSLNICSYLFRLNRCCLEQLQNVCAFPDFPLYGKGFNTCCFICTFPCSSGVRKVLCSQKRFDIVPKASETKNEASFIRNIIFFEILESNLSDIG